MTTDWYEKHYRKKETPEFVRWFEEVYGRTEHFSDHESDPDEYWTRRAFALLGWRGSIEHAKQQEKKTG